MEIFDILEKKTIELKQKSFNDLKGIVGNVQCFKEEFCEKSYYFEVHATQNESGKIYIMVECARDIIFLRMFSKQIYFSIGTNGEVEDISGEDYWV